MKKQKGMTLIEVIIVIIILLIVLLLIYKTYTSIYNSYKNQAKMSEMDTEKLIAIEIIRKDLEMAGFGLPWGNNGTLSINYNETAANLPCDDEPNREPRAICNRNNSEYNQSDYLVIKSTMALISNPAVHKMVYLYYDGTAWKEIVLSNDYFNTLDYFIILELSGRKIQCVDSQWLLKLPTDNTTIAKLVNSASNFTGNDNQDAIYIAYGIVETNKTLNYSKPFNRVDYYLDVPDTRPRRCAPYTYTLYRATINHTDGKRHSTPIMDCILDFQVAFGIDTNNDTKIDTWIDNISGYSPSYIRNQLRQVKVYIVYQEGQKSEHKVFDSSTIEIKAPDNSTIKNISLSSYNNYQYYRWRVLQFGVDTINLKPLER